MNKASGGDEIPVELFQILKDDVVKVLHSVCQQIWKTQQWPQDWKKVCFYSNTKERQCQTTAQLHSSHSLAKYCSKFSKPDFNSIWTVHFQMFKLDLEKAEEPEIKWPTSVRSLKKHESSRKTSISALLTTPKLLIMWITINCRKFFRRWEFSWRWSSSGDHLTRLLRNPYAGQEATVRTGHGTD